MFFFKWLKKSNEGLGIHVEGETLPSTCEAPRFNCKHHNKGSGKWWEYILSYVKIM